MVGVARSKHDQHDAIGGSQRPSTSAVLPSLTFVEGDAVIEPGHHSICVTGPKEQSREIQGPPERICPGESQTISTSTGEIPQLLEIQMSPEAPAPNIVEDHDRS